MQFGTLNDYFNSLNNDLNDETNNIDLPILSGDFFTYADRDDHYWSGMNILYFFWKSVTKIFIKLFLTF